MNRNPSTCIRRSLLVLACALAIVLGPGCGEAEKPDRTRVLFIGLDGADWRILAPLIEAGRLPNIQQLMRDGVAASLGSIQPIISPVIWTTIATGYGPDEHGVVDFTVPDPDTGDPIVITSRHRLSKSFWDILTEEERSVGVVGWWASWPAEEVDGFVVSDRMLAHAFIKDNPVRTELTFPDGLAEELSPKLIAPGDVTHETASRFFTVPREEYESSPEGDFNDPVSHFKHIFATMTNVGAAAAHLLESRSPEVMAAYFEGTDTAGHMYMRYAPPRYPYATQEQQAAFGGAVDEFFVYADEQLGRLLQLVDEETYVMVVSDHGFLTGGQRPLESRANLDYRTAALWHRLDGVLLLKGPGVKAGVQIQPASVFDVLPTLLHLLDLPVAEDFRGNIVSEAFSEPPRPATIPTYRDVAWRESRESALQTTGTVDEAMMEKLRSLGYIGGSESGALVSLRGHLALAQYYTFIGEKVKAIEELNTILEKAPDFHPAHYQLGLLAMEAKEYDRAEEYFRATLEAAPGDPPATQNLGFILRQKGRRDEATELMREGIAANPNDPGIRLNLSILLRETGKTEEALAELQTLLDRFPGHLGAERQIALTLHGAGRFDEAIVAWERVLVAAPNDKTAQEYLQRARERQLPG